MICLIHGYGLTGSGSNLWTRAIAQAMCQNGETVHLVCQENRPEQLDFIAEAYVYAPDGTPERLFAREVPYPGRCVVHRPKLDILPTYVRPKSDVTSMASILDLSADAIDDYLARNETALQRVVETHGITAMHVNHVVLMAVAAQRVHARTGVPYAVMPHGSAIEYVVKHDARMHALASRALADAALILTLSSEMRERIADVFAGTPHLEAKMMPASAGVDTSLFGVIPRDERPASIARLKATVAGTPRAKTPERSEAMLSRLRDDLAFDELKALVEQAGDYPPRQPDADLEAKLDDVDWERERIVAFVGKLISYKGVPALVAAMPAILARDPGVRLVVAGRGPLREVLEAFVWALASGHRTLVRNIARWGSALEGEPPAPFTRVERYFERLEAAGKLDAYFAAATRHLTPDRILFTGYMEHDALCHLFPCCDVAIFPSVVKEAAPLVVPEAMASGCFPMGTDYAGMATSLDVAAQAVPPQAAAWMPLRHDPHHTVEDIVAHVPQALAAGDRYRQALRDVAVAQCDWRSVARRLSDALTATDGVS